MRSPPEPWVRTDGKGNPKKTDIEMLVLVSKDLEHRLHTELGAQGNSLGERMRWCRTKTRPGGRPMLSAGLEKKLDQVKGWRNLVVHEWGVDTISDEERATLVRIYKEIRNTLKQIAAQIKAAGPGEGPGGEASLPLSSRVRDKDNPEDVGIVVDSSRGLDGVEKMEVAFRTGNRVVSPQQVELDPAAELLQEGARFVLRKNSPRETELRGLVGVIKSVSDAGDVTAEFQESPIPDWRGTLGDCEGVVGTAGNLERVRVGSPVRRTPLSHADPTVPDGSDSRVGTVVGRADNEGKFNLVVDFPGDEGALIDPRQLEVDRPAPLACALGPDSPETHEGQPPRVEGGADGKADRDPDRRGGAIVGAVPGRGAGGGRGQGQVPRGAVRPSLTTASDEGRSGVAGARPGEQAGLLRVGAKVRVHDVAIYLPSHDKAAVPRRAPRASVGPLLQVRKICPDGRVEVSFNDPTLGQLAWAERAENLEVVVGPRGPDDGVSEGTQIRRRREAAEGGRGGEEVGRVVGSTIKPTGSYALLADFGNGEHVSVSPLHVEVEPSASGSVPEADSQRDPPVATVAMMNARKSASEGGHCSPELKAMQTVEEFEAILNARGAELGPGGGQTQIKRVPALGLAAAPGVANAHAYELRLAMGSCAPKGHGGDSWPRKFNKVCSPKSAPRSFQQGTATVKVGANNGSNTNRSIGGSTVDGSDAEGRPMDGQFNDTDGQSGASRLDSDCRAFKLGACRIQNVT